MRSLIQAKKVLTELRRCLDDKCPHPVQAVRLSATDLQENRPEKPGAVSILVVFGEGWTEGIELSDSDFDLEPEALAAQIVPLLDRGVAARLSGVVPSIRIQKV